MSPRRAPRIPRALRALARAHGVLLAYRAYDGRTRRASREAVLGVLRALGEPLERPADAAGALRRLEAERWGALAEPVEAARTGDAVAPLLRLPASATVVRCRLDLEDGSVRAWSARAAGLRAAAGARVGGRWTVARRMPVPGPLPEGYHALRIAAGGRTALVRLVVAPRRLPAAAGHDWGVFCPLYALRSRRALGGLADFSDLERLARFARRAGGTTVATTPILAALLGEPFEPSPYAPASRLFWNEVHADLAREPEHRSPQARAVLATASFRREAAALAEGRLVEWDRAAALQGRLLDAMARACVAAGGSRAAALRRHLSERPVLAEYARFRGVLARRRTPWGAWPEAASDAPLRAEEADPRAELRHAYGQWVAAEQMAALAARARAEGRGLYLDLPIGAHPDGFDVWREREAFARGASVGAPPDACFPQGQDWGFPPMRPAASRAQGHAHFAACVRHHARHARVLRIDHVMGLRRLYWIPRGLPKEDGAYVRCAARELRAVATLEAARAGAQLVGENLGTVPPIVDLDLARDGWLSTFVVQVAAAPRARQALPKVPRACVASLQTHDMPPFASYLAGTDVPERTALGLLGPKQAEAEAALRARIAAALSAWYRRRGLLASGASPRSMLRAALGHLARSRAALVLVNLEDLWLETQAQNVPGTWRERPNWRLRARRSLGEVLGSREVRRELARVGRLRAARP